MTREERLQHCKICANRKMDLNKGLLCGLTNAYASFQGLCVDFVKDEEEKQRRAALELSGAGRKDVGHSTDANKNKKFGALIFFIGLFITFISHALAAEFGFFIITYGAIIYGASQYLKGVEQKKILAKQDALNEEIEKEQNELDSGKEKPKKDDESYF